MIIKDLKISKDMGAWKIKHNGDCIVQNKNIVLWFYGPKNRTA